MKLFIEFLEQQVPKAKALYILGDLFETWIGDDAVTPAYEPVLDAFQKVTTETGVPVYVMHGNRDFLLDVGFEDRTGCKIIPDPSVVTLYGIPTLLTHGDTLCTDDTEYQEFRKDVRNPLWQETFLARSVEERQAVVERVRLISKEKTKTAAAEIMDVNQQAVESLMMEHDVVRLIHGHTHRKGSHRFALDGRERIRHVMGDWDMHGSVLTCLKTCRLGKCEPGPMGPILSF